MVCNVVSTTVKVVRRMADGWQAATYSFDGGIVIYVPPIEYTIQPGETVSYFMPQDGTLQDSYWRIMGGSKIPWPAGVETHIAYSL